MKLVCDHGPVRQTVRRRKMMTMMMMKMMILFSRKVLVSWDKNNPWAYFKLKLFCGSCWGWVSWDIYFIGVLPLCHRANKMYFSSSPLWITAICAKWRGPKLDCKLGHNSTCQYWEKTPVESALNIILNTDYSERDFPFIHPRGVNIRNMLTKFSQGRKFPCKKCVSVPGLVSQSFNGKFRYTFFDWLRKSNDFTNSRILKC